ncbi:MAG: Dyp-type peroxidase [Chloroflexota bacterium]|nr:Dyp-type peroxidase [Chloroflexota bacterium]
MAQAKGILPRRREETESLYGNPRMCGYFIGVTLRSDLDRAAAQQWFQTVSGYVDELVERLPPEHGQAKGDKVAAVAVGLAPTFFVADGRPRFDRPIELPAGFDPDTADSPNPQPFDTPDLAAVERVGADVMFYVASIFEARVAHFIEQIQDTAPDVAGISIDRGYQRIGGKEPFGYADGVRNIARGVRSRHVFVQPDTDVDEPRWAFGGSYMTFMRIVQDRDAFEALADDAARDAVIGRHRDGTRLDLDSVDPRREPAEPVPNLPPASHVRKAAPRGHHDDTQIFRRGLPFLELADGRVRVGLSFASFQSSLDQFDTVLNDWMLSPNFPADGAGPDALLDPARGFTSIERVGLYFVPPHDDRHLAATLFDAPTRRPREGRLVVRKRVVDPSDARRRFERAGFRFRVLDSAGHPVGDPFTTSSSGRAVLEATLTIGSSYTLEELHSPVANVALARLTFEMDRPNKQLRVVNSVSQPNTPYGG